MFQFLEPASTNDEKNRNSALFLYCVNPSLGQVTRVRRFRVDIIVSGSVRSKEKHLLIHVLSPYTYDVYYNKCSTGQTGDLFMYLKFGSFRIKGFFIVIGLCWKSKSFQVKYKVKRDEKFKQNIKPLSRIVCVRSCI